MCTDMNDQHNLLSEKRGDFLISESILCISFMGCSLNYFIWNNNVLFGKPMLFYVIQTRMKWVKKATQILMRMTHNFKCWIQFSKPFKVLLSK